MMHDRNRRHDLVSEQSPFPRRVADESIVTELSVIDLLIIKLLGEVPVV